MFGALHFTFYRRNICLAISATAKKNFLFSCEEKKVVLDCFYIALSPISLEIFYRRRRHRLKIFYAGDDSHVGDSAKKYKTAIFKPKPSKF